MQSRSHGAKRAPTELTDPNDPTKSWQVQWLHFRLRSNWLWKKPFHHGWCPQWGRMQQLNRQDSGCKRSKVQSVQLKQRTSVHSTLQCVRLTMKRRFPFQAEQGILPRACTRLFSRIQARFGTGRFSFIDMQKSLAVLSVSSQASSVRLCGFSRAKQFYASWSNPKQASWNIVRSQVSPLFPWSLEGCTKPTQSGKKRWTIFWALFKIFISEIGVSGMVGWILFGQAGSCMFLEPEQLLAEQPASHDSVACMSSVCFLSSRKLGEKRAALRPVSSDKAE